MAQQPLLPPTSERRLRGQDILRHPSFRRCLLGRGGDPSLVESLVFPRHTHVASLDFLAARIDGGAAAAAPPAAAAAPKSARFAGLASVSVPGGDLTRADGLFDPAHPELWTIDLSHNAYLCGISGIAKHAVLGRVNLAGCTRVGFAELAEIAPVQIMWLDAPPLGRPGHRSLHRDAARDPADGTRSSGDQGERGTRSGDEHAEDVGDRRDVHEDEREGVHGDGAEMWHPSDVRALLVRMLPRCWCIDGQFVTSAERQAARAFFDSEDGKESAIWRAWSAAVRAADESVESSVAGRGHIHSWRALEVKRAFSREPVNSRFADKRRLKFLAAGYHRDHSFHAMQAALDARGDLALFDEAAAAAREAVSAGRGGGGGRSDAASSSDATSSSDDGTEEDAGSDRGGPLDSDAHTGDWQRRKLERAVALAETEAAARLVPEDHPTAGTPFAEAWASSLSMEARLQLIILLTLSLRYRLSEALLTEAAHSLLAAKNAANPNPNPNLGKGDAGGGPAAVDPERDALFIGGYPSFVRKALLVVIHEAVERERNLGVLRHVELVLWRALKVERDEMGPEEVQVLATLGTKLITRLQFAPRQEAQLREAEDLLDAMEMDMVASAGGAAGGVAGGDPGTSRAASRLSQISRPAPDRAAAEASGEASDPLRTRSITPRSRGPSPLPLDAADKAGLAGRRRLTKAEALAARGDAPVAPQGKQHGRGARGAGRSRGGAALPRAGQFIDAGRGRLLPVVTSIVGPLGHKTVRVDLASVADDDGSLRFALSKMSTQLAAQLAENPNQGNDPQRDAAPGAAPGARDAAAASDRPNASARAPAGVFADIPVRFLVRANGGWHLILHDSGRATGRDSRGALIAGSAGAAPNPLSLYELTRSWRPYFVLAPPGVVDKVNAVRGGGWDEVERSVEPVSVHDGRGVLGIDADSEPVAYRSKVDEVLEQEWIEDMRDREERRRRALERDADGGDRGHVQDEESSLFLTAVRDVNVDGAGGDDAAGPGRDTDRAARTGDGRNGEDDGGGRNGPVRDAPGDGGALDGYAGDEALPEDERLRPDLIAAPLSKRAGKAGWFAVPAKPRAIVAPEDFSHPFLQQVKPRFMLEDDLRAQHREQLARQERELQELGGARARSLRADPGPGRAPAHRRKRAGRRRDPRPVPPVHRSSFTPISHVPRPTIPKHGEQPRMPILGRRASAISSLDGAPENAADLDDRDSTAAPRRRGRGRRAGEDSLPFVSRRGTRADPPAAAASSPRAANDTPLRFGQLDRIFEKRSVGDHLRLEYRCKVVFDRAAPKYVWLDESQLPSDISQTLLDSVEWADEQAA